MEDSQPISTQPTACSKPHSRHRLRDNGSATRAEALLVNDELVQQLPELGNRAGARGKRVWTPITGCLATGESAAWDQSRFALSRCAASVIPLLGGEPRQRPAAKEIVIAGGSVLSNELADLRLMRVGGVRRRSGRGECLCDGGQVVDVGVGGVEAEPHGGDRCVGASCLAPGASISEMRSPIPPRGSAT